ncbi:type II toxin-antitoxin system RelE family toxin [Methanohalophilus profundi]|nr:hypothetical protein [Methanohalophilus profundi]
MRNDLTGYYRVHVMSSFVLIFGVDTVEETVTLVRFSHHDDAYDR